MTVCLYTPPELAAISALYRDICQVTTRYQFTFPIESADVEHVLAELRAAVKLWALTVSVTWDAERATFDVAGALAGKPPRPLYGRTFAAQRE